MYQASTEDIIERMAEPKKSNAGPMDAIKAEICILPGMHERTELLCHSVQRVAINIFGQIQSICPDDVSIDDFIIPIPTAEPNFRSAMHEKLNHLECALRLLEYINTRLTAITGQ